MSKPLTAEEHEHGRSVFQRVGDATPVLAAFVCRVLQPIVPAGWRGRIEVHVDDGVLKPENVAINMRPRQPKEGRVA